MAMSAKINDPAKANTIVNPIGRNMIPSVPVSVKMGRKTIMIMMMANNKGLPTSSPAVTIA